MPRLILTRDEVDAITSEVWFSRCNPDLAQRLSDFYAALPPGAVCQVVVVHPVPALEPMPSYED